jgi:hypothetical protein
MYMTILEATAKLLKYFRNKDVFHDQFSEIYVISENQELDNAAILGALKNLEESKIVSRAEVQGKSYWILLRPINSMNQALSISFSTAISVSDVINQFCEEHKDNKDICDPCNITEQDVLNLTILCHHYKKMSVEE